MAEKQSNTSDDGYRLIHLSDGPSTSASAVYEPGAPGDSVESVVIADVRDTTYAPTLPCSPETVAGYRGDAVEERFALYTKVEMPAWWEFRECLGASDRASNRWRIASDPSEVVDDHVQTELVALSLLHYNVYKGIAEALFHLDALVAALDDSAIDPALRQFTVLLHWKALNSGLYTSFVSNCQIVRAVVISDDVRRRLKNGAGFANYTYGDVKSLGSKIPRELRSLLGDLQDALRTRNQLDHRWPIWCAIDRGQFLTDRDHSASRIVLRGEQFSDPGEMVDGVGTSEDLIRLVAHSLNRIYESLLTEGLGEYLEWRNCLVARS